MAIYGCQMFCQYIIYQEFYDFESYTNNVQADLIIYFYLVLNFKLQIKWN